MIFFKDLDCLGGSREPPQIFEKYRNISRRGSLSHLFPTASAAQPTPALNRLAELGYGQGTHAPGLKLDARQLAQLNHYVVLAHGLSVQTIRAHAKLRTKVGIADNVQATTPAIRGVFDAC